ncbi:MAG: ABC transporter substrate-binding protein [Labilithrix sp.]|nr:ABC transporter substrate-binding protein [Labilithrix sp.]MCW5816472.1 ABC transporter substrate-binding protein [Labilithrix sp.]
MRSIHAAISVLALCGCASEVPTPLPSAGSSEPKRGGTVNLATFGDIRAIDPANVADGLAPQIVEQVFAGLVDFDHDGNIVPDLAERWELADEGKTYRFFLREGVRFHDGEEVTAADVKRSVERSLHGSAPNPYASYFTMLDGFDELNAKKAETMPGVDVEGRYVVAFHLKEPDATFLSLAAMLVLRPVCKSGGARYVDTWHPCGAGPFKLPPNGWEHGQSLTLVRHDGYFKPGLPYLDSVRWTFHQNQYTQLFRFVRGDLDVLRDFIPPEQLRFQADARWKPFGDYDGDNQIIGEAMNVEMKPFDNVEIRRAVSAAIDRAAIQRVRATNLRATNQLIPPGVPGYEPDIEGQKTDLSAALEHMRRAGYPYDPVTKKGGYPEVVPYLVYKQGLQEYTGQLLMQMLERIGIRLELRVVNYPTFLALRGRRHGSAIGPGFWIQDYPDALAFLEPMFHTKAIAEESSNNWSFYANPRFDDLVERAHRELDPARRKVLLHDAQGILLDDAPWAFTQTFRFYTQRQPYLRDHRTHPVWVHDFGKVWLDRAAGSVGARIFTPNALGALAR